MDLNITFHTLDYVIHQVEELDRMVTEMASFKK